MRPRSFQSRSGPVRAPRLSPPKQRPLRFTHRLHLTKSADFDRLYKEGRKIVFPELVFYYAPQTADTRSRISRFGFCVSRKMGKAVVRNRVKRIMREAVRLMLPEVAPGYDIAINSRTRCNDLSMPEVQRIIRTALVQASMLLPLDARPPASESPRYGNALRKGVLPARPIPPGVTGIRPRITPPVGGPTPMSAPIRPSSGIPPVVRNVSREFPPTHTVTAELPPAEAPHRPAPVAPPRARPSFRPSPGITRRVRASLGNRRSEDDRNTDS